MTNRCCGQVSSLYLYNRISGCPEYMKNAYLLVPYPSQTDAMDLGICRLGLQLSIVPYPCMEQLCGVRRIQACQSEVIFHKGAILQAEVVSHFSAKKGAFHTKRSVHIRGGQMVKSFSITSKIISFCLKWNNESRKTGL